jgi:mercuric ion binding protein
LECVLWFALYDLINQSKSIKINQNQSKSIKINQKLINMKTILISFLLLFGTPLFAQKTMVLQIQTSPQCGDCKERIETALNQSKGVVYAELNLESKVVEVKFKPAKTNKETLQMVLVNTGYQADDKKANPEALKALPLCCQPGGH